MNSEQKDIFRRLVGGVPDSLKAETASKVKYALESGWTGLFFWDHRKPHPADLFGVSPSGEIDVVPSSKQGLYDD